MLDSKPPSVPLLEMVRNEPRFRGLMKHIQEEGEAAIAQYQAEIDERFKLYQHMAEEGFSPRDPKALASKQS